MKGGVCFFAHDGQGNYLLGKRGANLENEPGCWSPGAGGIEFGESVLEALAREVKEEYGATVRDSEFMGFRHFINDSGNHVLMFDYRVLVDPKEVINNEPDKCEGLKWMTVGELEEFEGPFHRQMDFFMENFRNHIK